MTEPSEPTVAELERAAQLARSHEHAQALAALTFDLVSRQAEGRVLYTGERFVSSRAEAHGVDAKMAETPLGSVLTVLDRGPETRAQWALLSALYVRGVVDACEGKLGEERSFLLARFVAHADWLEASTPHRPLALARWLMPETLAAELCTRLTAVVLREDAASSIPSVRSRNALRLAALSWFADAKIADADGSDEAFAEPARRALGSVAAKATDPWSRALAGVALADRAIASSASGASGATPEPQSAIAHAPLRISGVLSRTPLPSWRSPLRWLSGFALLRWSIAGVAALLGVRRHAIVELEGRALSVRVATRWLGRTVRSSDVVHGVAQIASARRIARYASLHLLVGVTLFAAGALLGGYFLRDALRTGDRTLLLAGAGLVLGGALLDLVLSVIVPATARRVRVELDLGPSGRLHLAGVPATEADRFMLALRDELATTRKR